MRSLCHGKRKEMLERRKHKRFKVQIGTFAVLGGPPWPHSTKVGQIIDIGRDGLAFHYVTSEGGSNGSFELGILFAYHGFYCDKVPVKTISDHKLVGKFLFSSKTIWQRSLQFGDLTNDQKSQLKQFLQHYTSMVERSEKERRQLSDPQYSGPERRSGSDRRSA